ncbi:hypothetical protein TIFTF001_029212 [Ficus carica]|uniref:Uncharacterized protein n=1 Tax=Ficus carica TaxID=3494 RepID=A0AA88J346_FICCA|nr:hypothetical protein TIFTF001_029212 [Ficus carica]
MGGIRRRFPKATGVWFSAARGGLNFGAMAGDGKSSSSGDDRDLKSLWTSMSSLERKAEQWQPQIGTSSIFPPQVDGGSRVRRVIQTPPLSRQTGGHDDCDEAPPIFTEPLENSNSEGEVEQWMADPPPPNFGNTTRPYEQSYKFPAPWQPSPPVNQFGPHPPTKTYPQPPATIPSAPRQSSPPVTPVCPPPTDYDFSPTAGNHPLR